MEDRREAAVDLYGDMVWRLALARTGHIQDAQDVFQEVFLRYFRHQDKLATHEHRRAWLIRCTINCSNSLLASLWRRRTVPLEAAAQLGVRDEYRDVWWAVMALPPKLRTAIHLFYYEGLSIAEISAATGAAQGTVKSWLSRGRDKLREALSEVEL